MPHDQPYLEAEKKIEQVRLSGAKYLYLDKMQLTEIPESLGQLTQLQWLVLSSNQLTGLPKSLGRLTQLQWLDLSGNQLTELPESLGELTQLQTLNLFDNKLTALPEALGRLTQLKRLDLDGNQLTTLPKSLEKLSNLTNLFLGAYKTGNPFVELPIGLCFLTNLNFLDAQNCNLIALPEWIGGLSALQTIYLRNNKFSDLPSSLAQLEQLEKLHLDGNPLNPELATAYKQGLDAVRAYLRAKANSIILNEAKLILVGEGEVGKTCLMDALLNNKWQEHPSTHGIEINSFKITHPDTQMLCCKHEYNLIE